MSDARTLFEKRMETARVALAGGDRLASAEALSEGVAFAKRDPQMFREHADTLIRLAQLKQQLSLFLEAERLLTEALTVSERNFGKKHADLTIVLNELTRLYLRQSKFARAEPLLKRLLEITRAKGEDHSQVATVFAGLAMVRQGLGEHGAAEAFYRKALDIREKNFAPNDMAIAKTLELLAQTCADGGKFAEALAMCERALPMRVQSLGADHASVTEARERIAELERNVADEARLNDVSRPSGDLSEAAVEAAPSPMPVSHVPMPVSRVYPPALQGVPLLDLDSSDAPAPVAARAVAPPVAAPVAEPVAAPIAARVVAPKAPPVAAPVAPPVPPPAKRAPESPKEAARVETRAAPWRAKPARATPPWSTLVTQATLTPASPGEEVSAEPQPPTFAEPAPALAQPWAVKSDDEVEVPRHEERIAVKTRAPSIDDSPTLVEPKKRPANVNMMVVGIAAVLVVGVGGIAVGLFVARGKSSEAPSNREPLAVATVSAATPEVSPPAPTPAARSGAAIDSAKVGAKVTPHVVAPPPKETPQPTVPEAQLRLPSVGRVNLPNIATTNVDSVVRSANAKGARESSSELITVGGSGERLRSSAYGDALNAATPPKMLGISPQPRYPDALRAQALEGEVVVRFQVDESGRVDPSTMKVVRSPHELFTVAVRNVLSKFRFDPARTAAPDSKPRTEWVEYNVQFHPK